jgi:hypothetical protein
MMTMRELRFLERAVEDGANGINLVRAWRLGSPGLKFEHFLADNGIPLRRPSWESDTANTLVDQLVAQQVRHEERGGL